MREVEMKQQRAQRDTERYCGTDTEAETDRNMSESK